MKPPDYDFVGDLLCRALEKDDADLIASYGALLDDLERRSSRPTPSLLTAARWYARQGLHVFALSPKSKMPHPGSRGLLDATTDEEAVQAMWHRWPGSNVGIATGHRVDVVDIDGIDGNAALAQRLHDTSEQTPYQGFADVLGVVSTPRAGGRHLYVRADADVHNGTALFPHVDYRALGGYVVAPPSRTDTGVYAWTRALDVRRLGL